MQKKLMETIPLTSGLTLEFYDRSRHLAGDRCQVTLEARIEFDLGPDDLPEESGLALKDVRGAIGDRIAYSREKQRNFVPEADRDRVLGELKAEFLAASLVYLSNPDFRKKLVVRKYQQSKTYTPMYLRV
jgi:hypothetical protein